MFKTKESWRKKPIENTEVGITWDDEVTTEGYAIPTVDGGAYTKASNTTTSGHITWNPNTTTTAGDSYWYTGPRTGTDATRQPVGGVYEQQTFEFGHPPDHEMEALKAQVSELQDMLAAAWEAITELQNAVDEIS